MKRALTLAVKCGLSIALIGWVVGSLDLGSLGQVLARLQAWVLILALVLMALQGFILGWRWHRIVTLLGGELSPANAMRWVFMGLFFNQALPTSIGGDAVRIWKLRQHGASLNFAFGSVALERASGLAIMGLMISACVPAVWYQMNNLVLLGALLLAGPMLAAGLILAAVADRFPANWLPPRPNELLARLCGSLRRIATRPLALLEVSGLAALASLTGFLAAFVLGANLGIDLGLPAYIVLVGGAVLLSVLPISLGGWGVREIGMVALFGAVGVPAEPALALSLAWGLMPLLASLPGGLLWWLDSRVDRSHARPLDTPSPSLPKTPEVGE